MAENKVQKEEGKSLAAAGQHSPVQRLIAYPVSSPFFSSAEASTAPLPEKVRACFEGFREPAHIVGTSMP